MEDASARPHADAVTGPPALWDAESARQIFDRYFERLVLEARKHLRGTARADADEYDIASSVMASFFRGVQSGRVDGRMSQPQLWGLLRKIAERKVFRLWRRRATLRRGAGGTKNFSDLGRAENGVVDPASLASQPGTASTLAEARETLWSLMEEIDDPLCRQVLILRLAGHTHREIASQLGCATRTVERKVQKLQLAWGRLGPNDSLETDGTE